MTVDKFKIHKLSTTQKKQTKQNTAKQNNHGSVAFMTLGHKIRWAYSTMLPSPQRAVRQTRDVRWAVRCKYLVGQAWRADDVLQLVTHSDTHRPSTHRRERAGESAWHREIWTTTHAYHSLHTRAQALHRDRTRRTWHREMTAWYLMLFSVSK